MQHSQRCCTSEPCLPVIFCVCGLLPQVHFDGNSATDLSAGAIFASVEATSITGCTFTGNAADGSGGAVLAAGSTLTINQVSVKGQPWWLR
jgi:hypothetical protein